ncbi:tetratricopeptide repeat protein [Caulobacter sp. SLTY]|uniref:aspartyl/asparaginyl beta-hydroxylase domain-containing protein n=1 Tax=Caulobacter sp. SLTY TaxID=2683262 RepID=UPI0014132862|nr:aspartyl/asparaginyl beta-hydroxylase domain-containing protein [Caulobacter sp. SLTY]NBB13826.1 tetratricopeptide repeat protein [Caulobacter sp. SLTY]
MASDTSVLVGEAMAALQRRDGRAAMAMLEQARAQAPEDLNILMNIALAQRVAGDMPGAIATLDRVLMADPYHFMAMLSKGALVEQVAGPRQAAPVYEIVLKIAPPTDRLPPGVAGPLARARQVVSENADRLAEHIQAQIAAVKDRHGNCSLERFDESLEILAGRRKAYVSDPVDFHYPRLPAIPFFDREHFPWLPELEAATDMIRGELEAALAAADADFAPYIDYPAGAPVNQWAELNKSRRWRSLWLWKDGRKQEAACAQCPGTADLLSRLPLADQPEFAPTALFSALEAHTHIPPHTGSTNARLLVHLPLILPGPARFRVGNDIRDWKMGQAWAFDDTIEHEAWNDADSLRVILIFDVWNPLLSEAERELIGEMMLAKKSFYAG